MKLPLLPILICMASIGISASTIFGQSLKAVEGVTASTDTALKHSPKKAAFYSAVLPGLGQIYNKKYWKIPVYYGIGGGLVFWAISSNKQYQLYRETYRSRVDTAFTGTDHFPNESNAGLREEMERHQKNRELAIILTGVVYIAQIVDAAVDAHLRYFDVSENLSMRLKPSMQLNLAKSGYLHAYPTITLQMTRR